MAMIQWFPGHMHLTQKAIKERLKAIDVVIELLDARLPGSSANPLLAQLTQGKPVLKILNKQDLAQPQRTQQWLAYYNAQANTRAVALDASMPTKALLQLCWQLAPNRGGPIKPMRVLICGIPNVGKSTLINSLLGRRAAKTGDEAGITKTEQRLALAPDFYLFDTPGMLWPRIIVAQSGYNLAASGALGRNAFDEQEVALQLLAILRCHYPDLLQARFKLAAVALRSDEQLLADIGRQRGALQGGNQINWQKAAEIVIYDFRAGSLGRISLESPTEFAHWLALGQTLDAQRQLKKNQAPNDKAIGSKA